MQTEVMIEINSTQEVEGELNRIELTTVGTLEQTDGRIQLTYEESEKMGLDGLVTTLSIESPDKVVLIREGAYGSHMILEKGKRHLCHYLTMYGEFMMGVSAQHVESHVRENGGDLNFRYTLDISSVLASTNEIHIQYNAIPSEKQN